MGNVEAAPPLENTPAVEPVEPTLREKVEAAIIKSGVKFANVYDIMVLTDTITATLEGTK